jgi:hypothetical protein
MTRPSKPLLAVLGLTLATSLFLALQPDADDAVAPAVPTRQRGDTARPAPAKPERQAPVWPTALPARDAVSWRPIDAAVANAWGVPLPEARPVAAAAPLTATEPPALDYTLIGRIDDAGQERALLMSPRRTLSVKVGDLLDGQWRVEALQDDGVDLVWLQGGVHQVIGYKKL